MCNNKENRGHESEGEEEGLDKQTQIDRQINYILSYRSIEYEYIGGLRGRKWKGETLELNYNLKIKQQKVCHDEILCSFKEMFQRN